MGRTSRSFRRRCGFILLGLCLLVLTVGPAHVGQAERRVQPVANALVDWIPGTFDHTALGERRIDMPPNSQPEIPDQAGAVQLASVGLLKPWTTSPISLPETLSDSGATAIGQHLFVIGGTTLLNPMPTPTAHVWTTTINPSSGALTGPWIAEPDLPAIQTSVAFPTPIAPRAAPAVLAVQTGPESGYLYVIGGSVLPAGAPGSLSSTGVNITRVLNGRVDPTYAPDTNGWATGASIPTSTDIGLQSAAALSFTRGGKTYLYLLGGLQRYADGAQVRSRGSRAVFYAQVGAQGELRKPSDPSTPGWERLADIPIPSQPDVETGLWDGTALTVNYQISGPGGDALYLLGGQVSAPDTGPPQYSSTVYRARINADGTLTWADWSGTLPEARIGMAAVQFRGTIMLTGGQSISGGVPRPPQQTILTSYITDDLRLPVVGAGQANFITSASALGRPRAHHAIAIVPALPTQPYPIAIVYVIGGQGDPTDSDPTDDHGSTTVIVGKIDDESSLSTGFVASGWYYSAPHDTRVDGARLQAISWTTLLTRTSQVAMDIALEYRASSAADCATPAALANSTWTPLDGTPDDGAVTASANGTNTVVVAHSQAADCAQFRAHFTTKNPLWTPALLNVGIVLDVDYRSALPLVVR